MYFCFWHHTHAIILGRSEYPWRRYPFEVAAKIIISINALALTILFVINGCSKNAEPITKEKQELTGSTVIKTVADYIASRLELIFY